MGNSLVGIKVSFFDKGSKIYGSPEDAEDTHELWLKPFGETAKKSEKARPHEQFIAMDWVEFEQENIGFAFRFFGESCTFECACGLEWEVYNSDLKDVFDQDLLDEIVVLAKEVRAAKQVDADKEDGGKIQTVNFLTLWDYSTSYSTCPDSYGEWSSHWSLEGIVPMAKLSEILAKPSA